jgi:hypothetical protein
MKVLAVFSTTEPAPHQNAPNPEDLAAAKQEIEGLMRQQIPHPNLALVSGAGVDTHDRMLLVREYGWHVGWLISRLRAGNGPHRSTLTCT